MSYSQKTIAAVEKAPRTNGTLLALWAIYHNIPVTMLAQCTGASRQTIYNWFSGRPILRPYEDVIDRVLDVLQSTQNSDEARRKLCKSFKLST